MFQFGRLRSRLCSSLSRREMLQVGACSALGLSLPGALAAANRVRPASARVKSVLLLWQWGGPSHHETWDPKSDAPSQVRGCFRPISTATPGTRICELLPHLARRTNDFAILRSLHHDQTDHNVGGTVNLTGHLNGAKASGGIPFPGSVRPSLGSLVSFLARGRKQSDWPSFLCVGPVCKVSGEQLRGQTAGVLGAAHDPFRLDGFSFEEGVKAPPALSPLPGLESTRFGQRYSLLTRVDAAQRRLDASGEGERLDALRQRAFAMVTSPAAKAALDLDQERDSLRDRYGRTIYGQNLLLARRLVEAGVPFVQVNWSGDAEDEQQGGDGGWDLHYRLFERMQERYCPIFDRAFSALLDDLKDRGLLDSTLVISVGEFGRSPKISSSAGREHWPFVYSAVVAGGGVPGGLVYGSSTPDGGHVNLHGLHPAQLTSTVLAKMGLDRFALGDKGAGIIEGPIEALM